MKIVGHGSGTTLILTANHHEIATLLGTDDWHVSRLTVGTELQISNALKAARSLSWNATRVQESADELQKLVDALRQYDPEAMILDPALGEEDGDDD